MRNSVTVTQTFPSLAAANAVRERLAEERGFDRYGIDEVAIERLGGQFELLIRTDEYHRDQIEHLLRSSGTAFNPPAAQTRRWGAVAPALLLGAAAVTSVALYTLWNRSERRPDGAVRLRGSGPLHERPGTPMFTLEVGSTPIAVTKGNEGEARAVFDDPAFRQRLRSLENNGRPLWNGNDLLGIRPATPSEIRALVEYADKLGFDDEEEGEIVLYLVPVDNADEFDETQDG
ncbi:MAG TPA: hypothetical protein VH743_20635 [Beijerinckiaceae bacterium]|jgi:hypothetical protein